MDFFSKKKVLGRPLKMYPPDSHRLRNKKAVCMANSTAQIYASVVYHYLQKASLEEKEYFTSTLEKTEYGGLLLSMIHVLTWREEQTDMSWKCVSNYDDGRYMTFSRLVLELCLPLKEILSMHITISSYVDMGPYSHRVKQTLDGTYGLTLQNATSKHKSTYSFVINNIDKRNLFRYGTLTLLNDYYGNMTNVNSISDVYFEHTPAYLTLASSDHVPTPSSVFSHDLLVDDGWLPFDIIPEYITIRDESGTTESTYRFLSGIIRCHLKSNVDDSFLVPHAVAVTRYDEQYFLYSDMDRYEVNPSVIFDTSVISTEFIAEKLPEVFDGYVFFARAECLIYTKISEETLPLQTEDFLSFLPIDKEFSNYVQNDFGDAQPSTPLPMLDDPEETYPKSMVSLPELYSD